VPLPLPDQPPIEYVVAQARDPQSDTLWQARTGTRVNIFVAPTDLSYAQIDAARARSSA
jgi:hypothetical protein